MPHPFAVRLMHAGGLGPGDVDAVEALCGRVIALPAKRHLAIESDPVPMVPVLATGWAARCHILRNGARQITRVLLPGDPLFPHAAPCCPEGEDVVTITPCTLTHLRLSELDRTVAARPAIGAALRAYALMENAVLTHWVVNLGRRNALQRLTHLMCELQCRMQIIDERAADGFPFPLTQHDLADSLGLTPVHVNRKLQQLRHEGIVALRTRKLAVLDRARLQRLAGFDSGYLEPRSRSGVSLCASLAA